MWSVQAENDLDQSLNNIIHYLLDLVKRRTCCPTKDFS